MLDPFLGLNLSVDFGRRRRYHFKSATGRHSRILGDMGHSPAAAAGSAGLLVSSVPVGLKALFPGAFSGLRLRRGPGSLETGERDRRSNLEERLPSS